MLWMYQRVIFGPLKNDENKKLTDLSSREVLVFAPLLVMMVVMGLYPTPFLDRMEKSVTATLARAEAKRVADESRMRLSQDTHETRTVVSESRYSSSRTTLTSALLVTPMTLPVVNWSCDTSHSDPHGRRNGRSVLGPVDERQKTNGISRSSPF